MGKLVGGDVLQCHYHGLRFDRTGACVRVPGQDMIPATARVKSLSGGRALQVAVDLDGRSGAGRSRRRSSTTTGSTIRTGAPSPTTSTPSATGSSSTTTCSTSRISPSCTRPRSATWRWSSMRRCASQRTPTGVQVTRWIIDQPAPPAFVKIGGFTGNVDRWQIIDYPPPSFIRLDVGATPTGTGAPEGRRVGGIQMRNLNAMTPETETTTHYFWGQAHDFEPRNAEMTERVFQQIKTAFLEDVAVFTAQQQQHRARSRRADHRHQRRLRRHPGPPHRRPALRTRSRRRRTPQGRRRSRAPVAAQPIQRSAGPRSGTAVPATSSRPRPSQLAAMRGCWR